MEKIKNSSPLKIINASGTSTSKLQIADLYKNATFSGNLGTLNPDSPSKFRISFTDPNLADKETIEATLQITDPDNPNQPLESVTLILHKDPATPGHFISQELLTVSAPYADQQKIANQENDSPLDQTFYAKINSTLKVSVSTTTINAPDSIQKITYAAQANIPPKNVVTVCPVLIHDENGNPLATEADVNQFIHELQNGTAPEGTQVVVKGNPTLIKAADIGVTFQDGLSDQEKQKLANAILCTPSNPPHIKVALLGNTDLGPTKTTHHYKLDSTGKETGHPVVFAQNTTPALFLAPNFELIRKTNTAMANLNADPNYLLFRQPPANPTPKSSKTPSRDIFATSPPQQPSEIPNLTP